MAFVECYISKNNCCRGAKVTLMMKIQMIPQPISIDVSTKYLTQLKRSGTINTKYYFISKYW
jgi:hypothetical protein